MEFENQYYQEYVVLLESFHPSDDPNYADPISVQEIVIPAAEAGIIGIDTPGRKSFCSTLEDGDYMRYVLQVRGPR